MPDPQPSAFDWNRAWLDHRDRLPHVRQPNVIYFVTSRLIDSLPADRLKQLRLRRDDWLRMNPSPHSVEQERDYKKIWTTQIENWLDAGYGACVLRDPENRSFVEATLRHDDPQKYRLGDFVIMPNHVHPWFKCSPASIWPMRSKHGSPSDPDRSAGGLESRAATGWKSTSTTPSDPKNRWPTS